jgi:hypothetical protein
MKSENYKKLFDLLKKIYGSDIYDYSSLNKYIKSIGGKLEEILKYKDDVDVSNYILKDYDFDDNQILPREMAIIDLLSANEIETIQSNNIYTSPANILIKPKKKVIKKV